MLVRRSWEKLRRYLHTDGAAFGIQVGLNLEEASVWNIRTLASMQREKPQVDGTTRATVRMRYPGADGLVVAYKRSNAGGAKRAGYRRRHPNGPTGDLEEPGGFGGGR